MYSGQGSACWLGRARSSGRAPLGTSQGLAGRGFPAVEKAGSPICRFTFTPLRFSHVTNALPLTPSSQNRNGRLRQNLAAGAAASGRRLHLRIHHLGLFAVWTIMVGIRRRSFTPRSRNGGILSQHRSWSCHLQRRSHGDASHNPPMHWVRTTQFDYDRDRSHLARAHQHGPHARLWTQVRERLRSYTSWLDWKEWLGSIGRECPSRAGSGSSAYNHPVSFSKERGSIITAD